MHSKYVLKQELWYFFEQSAVGWEYQAELSKHDSQKDASKGFGGKYGVENDNQDQVCKTVIGVSWGEPHTMKYPCPSVLH